MHLLYLTNAFPYPLTSGHVRHYHLLRGLAERHDVHLLSLAGPDHRPEHEAALARHGVSSEVFDRGGRRARQARKALPGVPLGGLVALRRTARARISAGLVDASVLSGKQISAVLGGLRGRPLLVDLCDGTSPRLAGEARWRQGAERAALQVEWAGTRLVERRLRRVADHAIVASERDRALLRWPAEGCTVVRNGVDADHWRRRSRGLGRDTVVFTGTLDYPPDEDAALQLADALPALRAEVPEARLLIVGLRPTPMLLAAAERTGAVVTGEVPDVRPHLERASVFAAPLRFGAAAQNKLLEALAMDVPVVCSSLAAAGLRVDGATPPLEVADDRPTLVAALAARLRAASRDPVAGRAGSDYVRRHFSWARSSALLEAHLERLVAAAPPVRSAPLLRGPWTFEPRSAG